MTLTEFSNEFDILYNNITSNQAPGLDEYEKSVFLTKAQYEILKNYFNPKGNKYAEGFDQSAKRQIDFSNITVYKSLGKTTEVESVHFSKNSTRFQFPSDAVSILNETILVVRDEKEIPLTVVPISVGEYNRVMSKPYHYPLKSQAWRLLVSNNKSCAEIITGPNDDLSTASYIIRYIKKPLPIILEPLTGNLSIEGYVGTDSSGKAVLAGNTAMSGINSELDSELHPEILQRAIELAKAAYIGNINTQLQIGQRSE